MWVMTTGGFVSAVSKQGTLQVRARDRESLEALFDESRIMTNQGTDYPFRVHSTHEEFAGLVARVARQIDYTNFKDAAKAKRGAQYARALNAVWGAMIQMEPVGVLSYIGSGWRMPATKKGKKRRGNRFGSAYVDDYDFPASYPDWQPDRDRPEWPEADSQLYSRADLGLPDDPETDEIVERTKSIASMTEAELGEFLEENPI